MAKERLSINLPRDIKRKLEISKSRKNISISKQLEKAIRKERGWL
jgi:hypothetical protein